MRADFPFRPAALPFFYGWVILLASTLGVVMSVPGQTMGVSVFTDHLIAATGLSRLELSNAYLVGTVASGLSLPLGGSLVDRWGVRRAVVVASLGLAAMLVFLAHADGMARAVSAREPAIPLTLLAFAFLSVGFTGIRFTGQGMLTLTSRTMLACWFERRRGLVTAISGPFVSFGFAGAPLLLSLWIHRAGWRGAWVEMAIAVAVLMGGLGWLLFRDSPEECGLRMDGDPVDVEPGAEPEPGGEVARDASAPAPFERDFTRPEAVRTAAFWLVTLAIGSQALVGTGITFHIVSLGAELGLAEARAVAIFLPTAVVSAAVGFLAGVAVDRYPIRRLIMVMMAAQVVMFAAMAHFGDPWLRVLAILGWGVAGGFYGPLTVAALPSFFGRTHLGAIQGAMMSAIVIASALGPSTLAALRELFDSYQPGLYLMVGLPVAVFVVAPFTGDPRRAAAG
jgi:OFA family oxalate/formate antiporter-like MFS transporter